MSVSVVDITDVPNGTYQIEITVNNAGRLLETTAANNRSLRTVVLGGTPGHRTVGVPPVFEIRFFTVPAVPGVPGVPSGTSWLSSSTMRRS